MARIFFLHWNRPEAEARAAELAMADHVVSCHWNAGEVPPLREPLPEVVVISLDRLPSHGRAVAEWLREAKQRRQVPLIFAGGKPEKVAVAREQFPQAVFCASDRVVAAVAEALAGDSTGTARPGPGI
jgi:hypothetical protein